MADQVLSTVEPDLHLTLLGYALVGCACTKGENVNLECNIVLHKTIIPNIGRPLSVQIEFNCKSADDHDVDVFNRTPEDDFPGHSRDDQVFLNMIREGDMFNIRG